MHARYNRTESVVTRKIAGETMLIPVSSQLADLQQIFALDPVSAVIWEQLDGHHSLQQIAERLTDEFDVTVDVAQADTERFLNELHAAGLVEQA